MDDFHKKTPVKFWMTTKEPYKNTVRYFYITEAKKIKDRETQKKHSPINKCKLGNKTYNIFDFERIERK